MMTPLSDCNRLQFTSCDAPALSPFFRRLTVPTHFFLTLLLFHLHPPHLSDPLAPSHSFFQMMMTNLRDVFCNGLCNFTHLHSPATMKFKNALAFKFLLQVADSVGNHLQER